MSRRPIARFRRVQRRADQLYDRFRRGLRPRIEQLEPRLAMDGALPILTADAFSLRTNSDPVRIDILANDQWQDYAGPRRITSLSFPSSGGTAEVAADGQAILFRPAADFAGDETFTYFIDDQFSAEVTVHVLSPLRVDLVTLEATGQRHSLDVLANDPFGPDNTGPRRITAVSATQLGGTVTISADGRSLLYEAPDDPDALGQTDHITYIVDGKYPADVSIGLHHPLQADAIELLQHAAATTLLPLANDPFWEGYAGERQITSVFGAATGSQVTIAGDGRELVYRPADGFAGTESITYIVDRKFAGQYTVRVLRPVSDDEFAIDQFDPGMVFSVLTNDQVQYIGGPLTRIVEGITSVGPSAHGGTLEITADGQGVRYAPPADFVGEDSFDYVADGRYSARVRVNVARPVRDDFFSALQGSTNAGVYNSVMVESADNLLLVLTNDFIRAGQHAVTAVAAPSQGGSVAIAADGSSIIYSPRPGFEGVDEFTYTVDGQWSATAHVTVRPPVVDSWETVDPLQDEVYAFHVAPQTIGAGRYTGPGIVTSVELTSGTGVAGILPGGKSVSFAPGNYEQATIAYTLDGRYTARVVVQFLHSRFLSDDVRVVDQNIATTIDVQANDPFEYLQYEGHEWVRVVYAGPRTTTAAYGAQHGTVTLAADGKSLVYRPADDFVGEDKIVYLVDGRELASVTVHVVRHVRDDVFRVGPGSRDNVLPVLVNDLLAGAYGGAGRITGVTASPGGGQVFVSADGRSLLYTPAANFTGVEEVSYLVDGHLRAHVQIKVAAPPEALYPRFDTLAALETWLIDNALESYKSLFGQLVYPWRPGQYTTYNDSRSAESVSLSAGDASRAHSETNVQVAGVDEADISEADGDYLYVMAGGKLVISKAWPAESLEIVSQTPIDGVPIGMYLSGDRLTLIARAHRSYWSGGAGEEPASWFQPSASETIVTIFDVADRGQPRLVQKTVLDGEFGGTRAIGDFVYVQLRSTGAFALPGPEFKSFDDPRSSQGGDPPGDNSPSGRYETEAEYVQRVRDHFGELLDRMLPHYRSYGPDGSLVRGGLLVALEEIGKPQQQFDRTLLSVVAIDRAASVPGIASSTGILAANSDRLYMNRESLYFFHDTSSIEDGPTVQVVKFHVEAATGQIGPQSQGQVAGTLLNQFSVDEHNGDLRIATTIGNSWSGNWSNRAQNDVWVLRQDGDLLEPVGSLQNLAPGESIRSVRYLGERAVVTTFPTIEVGVDPVYVVDLANPQQPRVLGALTLPGFSQYMQFIDATHVLTVGVNLPTLRGPHDWWRWNPNNVPLQISLFDVSDLAHPHLLDQLTLSHFSQSLAQDDHHAFGWFAEHGLLALPISRTYPQRVDLDGDGYKEATVTFHADQVQYFRIQTDGVAGGTRAVELAGTVDLNSAALRTAFIGEALFAIGDGEIVASTVAAPSQVLARVSWNMGGTPLVAGNGDGGISALDVASTMATTVALYSPGMTALPGRPVPSQSVLVAGGAGSAEAESNTRLIAAARSDLARRLTAAPGAAVLVAVENEPASDRRLLVLRAGDRQYLYKLTSGDSVELVDDNFQFATVRVGTSWHNREAAGDVNGDGATTPLDVVLVTNHLNRSGTSQLAAATVLRQIAPAASDSSPGFFDVNGDGICTPLDVLSIINELNPPAAIAVLAAPAPTAIESALTAVATELADAATPGGPRAAIGSRSPSAAAFDVPAATTQASPGDSQPWTIDEDLLSVLTSRRRLRVG